MTKQDLERQMHEEWVNNMTKSTAAYMKEILVDNVSKRE